LVKPSEGIAFIGGLLVAILTGIAGYCVAWGCGAFVAICGVLAVPLLYVWARSE
jgi:hypothetical protein